MLRYAVSPGNLVLDPTGTKVLVRERALPKWGWAVDVYLTRFEQARKACRAGR